MDLALFMGLDVFTYEYLEVIVLSYEKMSIAFVHEGHRIRNFVCKAVMSCVFPMQDNFDIASSDFL